MIVNTSSALLSLSNGIVDMGDWAVLDTYAL